MLETFNSAEKTLVLRANHVSREFLQKMSKLRDSNNFIDVTLTSGTSADEIEIEIPAHKIILTCCSSYFEAMLCGNFIENSTNSSRYGFQESIPCSLDNHCNILFSEYS